MQGMMHIVQCALIFSLFGSGACKTRGLKKGPDSSEAIRLIARNAEMAHRKFIEPMGVRRQEETKIFHWRDDSAYIPRQSSIPAKIWITVPDKASVSTDVQEKIDIARSVNPGYKLTVHDDEDIKEDVKKLAPNFLKLFERLRPVEKADFWRYLIVYAYGGWYIDSDITVRKPFKEWVSAEDGDIGLVLGVEALRAPDMYQPLQICQWAFGGKAGNPLLARMLDFISYRYLSDMRWVDPGRFQPYIMYTTGPILVTRVVEEFLWDRQMDLEALANYSTPYVDGGLKILHFPLIRNDEEVGGEMRESWIVHHFKNSWQR